MSGSTPNYNLNLPTVGGDTGAWGSLTNDNWSSVDTDLKAVSDVADDALSRTDGGVVAANVDVLSLRPKVQQLGSVSGAVAIDLDLGFEVRCTLAGATTFSFTNIPAGSAYRTYIRIHIYNPSAAYAITWPAAVVWPAAGAPSGSTGFVTAAFNTLVEIYTDSAGSDMFGTYFPFSAVQ